MTTIIPEGENFRRTVKWISEQAKEAPEKSIRAFINEASIRFDLTPKDSQALLDFYKK